MQYPQAVNISRVGLRTVYCENAWSVTEEPSVATAV